MVEKNRLSSDDVRKLLTDNTPQSRVEVAVKIAREYVDAGLQGDSKAIAEQIFRMLQQDAEVLVRKSLSDYLKNAKDIPKDIILNLANDVNEVSIPILQFSEVLDDNDLISIIKTTVEAAKQTAISKREHVAEIVSDALIDTNKEEVVKTLLSNQGALIDSNGLDKIVSNFAESSNVLELLVEHSSVTVNIAEKIMDKVSSAIKKSLNNKYTDQNNSIKDEVLEKSKELATMRLGRGGTTDEELLQLINYIEQKDSFMQELAQKDSRLSQTIESFELSGKLTPFTALCTGSMPLFEITLARMIKVPLFNVRKLLNDNTNSGFEALYRKAGMPDSMFEAATILFNVLKEVQKEPEKKKLLSNPKQLSYYMTDKVISVSEGKEVDNLPYFVNLIKHYGRTASGG